MGKKKMNRSEFFILPLTTRKKAAIEHRRRRFPFLLLFLFLVALTPHTSLSVSLDSTHEHARFTTYSTLLGHGQLRSKSSAVHQPVWKVVGHRRRRHRLDQKGAAEEQGLRGAGEWKLLFFLAIVFLLNSCLCLEFRKSKKDVERQGKREHCRPPDATTAATTTTTMTTSRPTSSLFLLPLSRSLPPSHTPRSPLKTLFFL